MLRDPGSDSPGNMQDRCDIQGLTTAAAVHVEEAGGEIVTVKAEMVGNEMFFFFVLHKFVDDLDIFPIIACYVINVSVRLS